MHGVTISFLPVFLLPVLGNLGFANTTFSDTDFGVMGIIMGKLAAGGSQLLITGVIGAILAVLVVHNVVAPKKPKVE